MLELLGGGGSTSVARGVGAGAEKGAGNGLDFAQFLQEAQEREPTRAETAPQQKKKAIASSEASEREDVRDAAAEAVDESEGEEELEGKEAGDTTQLQTQPLADVRVGKAVAEELAEELAEESAAAIAEELEGVWVPPKPVADSDSAEGAEASEVDLGAEADLPAVALEAAPLETKSPLGLLNFTELMDSDLVVEKSPEQIVSRIVQAAGSQMPLMEEVAETVLPQVIRSVASLVRAGGAEMRLQLQPADLGEIELRVRTTEAMVRGEMLVQNPEVKQLLDQHMDRLRAALAEEGLELQGFNVDVGDQSRFARDGEGEQEGSRQRQGAGNGIEGAESTAEDAVAAASPRRLDNGDMDFTA
ncbi:MAG: flagellar hook-length control protein FliK [Candidatus Latescibacterota bacterium]|jgi:flagellar hook-length control protein FliK